MTEPTESFVFDRPDYFVGGAVGPPGQRVFHLQAAQDGEVVTLKCEKQHVAALAQHLEELLADLPSVAPDPGSRELREPIVDRWAVGALGLAYDDTTERVMVVCEELIVIEGELPTDPVDLPSGATARFAITRAQAAAFAATAEELLQGGRARCPICGGPMDLAGHVCPRSNGHRPH